MYKHHCINTTATHHINRYMDLIEEYEQVKNSLLSGDFCLTTHSSGQRFAALLVHLSGE